jgi:hypothetical protein
LLRLLLGQFLAITIVRHRSAPYFQLGERVAVGMHRQGCDLQLTQYDDRGWWATFYTSGMEHSPTSATGTGWERTPWRATAAGGVMRGVEEG